MDESYHFVSTMDDLNKHLPHFKQASTVAVDIEFDNKYSYDLVICLIQLATPKKTLLVDPFTVDPSPLASIFENEQVIKLFFAGTQDIQLLQTTYNWQLRSIIDISTIYQVVNDDNNQTSLNDVIEDILGIDIPKDKEIQSIEDWKQRPLPVSMQLYAARDVMYLHKLLLELQKHLTAEQKQLLEVYFLQVPLIEDQTENTLMYAFYLCNKYHFNDEKEKYLMFKLVQFRENMGEMTDQSSGYILSKSQLKQLVKTKPTSVFELKDANLYYKSIKKYSHDILEIIRDVYSTQEDPSDYYVSLKETYKTYYPYTEYLNRQYQWPYATSIESYRNRRGMLNILEVMIEDRVGDNVKYLYTKYLNHRLAIYEGISLFDLRRDIEASESTTDIINTIYAVTERIYGLLQS